MPSTYQLLTHNYAQSCTLYASSVNPRLSTLIYPLLITRWSFTENFFVLVNNSPQIWLIPWRLDQGSCVDLTPYLYSKQKHCIILFCFLRRTDQPGDLSNALSEYNQFIWPNDEGWVVSNHDHTWASNDFNMLNNDYDKKEIRNVNNIRKIDNVELN